MAKEIERKYLVANTSYRGIAAEQLHITQGYLSRNIDATIRVRISNDRAYLTVKGRNNGTVRDEWEYPIPVNDAKAMLQRCASGSVIVKTRYIVPCANGLKWEIDEFHGEHQGLTVAEIELPTEHTTFTLPPFIGKEVTGNPKYYNSNL